MYVFIGPLDGDITGQNLCLKALNDNAHFTVISNGGEGLSSFNKLLTLVIGFFSYIRLFLLRSVKFEKVVISVSRSKFGFIKDYPFFILSFLFGKKVYIHLHGNDFHNFYFSSSKFLQWLIKHQYQNCSAIIVPSLFMEKQFQKTGFESLNFIVVSNFHDSFFKSANLFFGKNILFLSNFIKEKGIFDVFDIYEKVKFVHKDASLTICGKNYLSPADSALFDIRVKQVGASYYTGVSRQEVYELYEKSDIFLFPSVYKTEASPLVLLEAMNASCAVFTYKHNGIEQVLPYANLSSVAPYDKVGLAECVISCLDSEDSLEEIKLENFNHSLQYSKENYVCTMLEVLGK